MFEGLSTPGTRGEIGNGLGLALCRDLAERNGGTVTIENIPGAGAAFTLLLPALPSSHEPPIEAEPAAVLI